tara:strand:- start:67 stop:657 length:591 start_codon:yes stop_codon:yes gene_type:complete
MNYNKPNTKLDECIYVAEKVIPADLCDAIVKDIETREWTPHQWYNVVTDTNHSEETMELDVQPASSQIQKQLGKFIIEAGRQYQQNYGFQYHNGPTNIMNQFCPLRFNRYGPGQIMRQHHDHIHSLFDGQTKGVPVLTFILNFNDNYEGADLYFWEDTVVPLGKGDIIMFPSCWLFPHGVTEATKGVRYSGSVWAW